MTPRVLVLAAVIVAGCTDPAGRCFPLPAKTALFEGYCRANPREFCFFEADPGFWPGGMRVGDSLEVTYDLPGPVSAGTYVLSVRGHQTARDAVVHADLILRSAKAADQTVASGDGMAGPAGGPGDLDIMLPAAAIAATCGDKLVARTTLVSGTSGYLEFLVSMITP